MKRDKFDKYQIDRGAEVLQMADVLNFFYPVAMQIQNVQFLKAVEILNAVNLVFAKHEDLNRTNWMHVGLIIIGSYWITRLQLPWKCVAAVKGSRFMDP